MGVMRVMGCAVGTGGFFFLGNFFSRVVIFVWGKSMPSGWMLSSYFLLCCFNWSSSLCGENEAFFGSRLGFLVMSAVISSYLYPIVSNRGIGTPLL